MIKPFEFYFDFASPYTFFAHKEIKKIEKENSIKVKYNISRSILFIPLILIYFAGPLGLVLYWIIRVFFAKKLGFHD